MKTLNLIKYKRISALSYTKKENKKYYEKLDLANVTDGVIGRRSGKLLKHFCRVSLQICLKSH